MAIGMKKYVQSAVAVQPRFLTTMTELDEYTYYVAGTVGHLLTGLFAQYSRNITPGITNKLHTFSASFGKGLQLVNIIRDLPKDWRDGRSYLPDEILQKILTDIFFRPPILEIQSQREHKSLKDYT